MDLQQLKKQLSKDLNKASNSKDLQDLKIKYLGKKGRISLLSKDLGKLSQSERPKAGKAINLLKKFFEEQSQILSKEIEQKEINAILETESIDISLPVESIDNFHKDAQIMIANFLPDLKTIYFGHLGDGNLHYNVFGNGSLPDGFEGKSLEFTKELYKIVHNYNGSFSAEHGIGLDKKKYLIKSRSKDEIELMRLIKKSIDPKNILNPGRVF